MSTIEKMEPVVRQNLIAYARAYARGHGKKLSQVSREIYGNSNFLDQFRRGKVTVGLDKLDEMLDTLGTRWPDGVAIPYAAPMWMRLPK
jgi:hypothetical protein